jgi:hypothetical protein
MIIVHLRLIWRFHVITDGLTDRYWQIPGMIPNMGPLLNALTGVWPYLSQYLELDQK